MPGVRAGGPVSGESVWVLGEEADEIEGDLLEGVCLMREPVNCCESFVLLSFTACSVCAFLLGDFTGIVLCHSKG